MILTRRYFKVVLILTIVVGLGIKKDFEFSDAERIYMYNQFADYTTNPRFLFPLFRDESNIIMKPDVQNVHNSYAGFLVNNGLIVTVMVLIVYASVLYKVFKSKRMNYKRLFWWLLLLGLTGMFNPFLLHRQIYFIVFFSLIFLLRNENSPLYYK